ACVSRWRLRSTAHLSILSTLSLLFILSKSLLPCARGQDEALLLRPPSAEATRALERVRLESLEPVDAAWELSTGRARSLEGLFPLDGAAGMGLPNACTKFIESEPALFGWSPEMELRLTSETSEIGAAHLRFATFFRGIPVTGGEVAFHIVLAPGGDLPPSLTHLTSRLFPQLSSLEEDLRDPLTPRISLDEATRVAEETASPRLSLGGESSAHLELYCLAPPA